MNNRTVHVIGGGTVSHIRNHLALSATAYGSTAREIGNLCNKHPSNRMDIVLHLSKMCPGLYTPYMYVPNGLQRVNKWADARFETPHDLEQLTQNITHDPDTKIVFFNPAVVDFQPSQREPSGKYEPRLQSANYSEEHPLSLQLVPTPKILDSIRKTRKDIFLVGFKTTSGASEEQQYLAALNMLKRSSCNIVLANDVLARRNMIVTPEEASYCVTQDRDRALSELVDMTYLRSHLTFTRSTVVSGESISWDSDIIPPSLKKVVEHCIEKGAYKKFRGVTAGHFAFKIDDQTFVTSKRKTDFNDLSNVGMVKIKTDGPDTVLAYGAKPSVGGQSQRIIFKDHPGYDCVAHFHCIKKSGSKVPVRSQRELECGSHQCGSNTSEGLADFDGIKAVYLDNHGPNIVFNRDTDPARIIKFIDENFDLTTKTGGYQVTQ